MGFDCSVLRNVLIGRVSVYLLLEIQIATHLGLGAGDGLRNSGRGRFKLVGGLKRFLKVDGGASRMGKMVLPPGRCCCFWCLRLHVVLHKCILEGSSFQIKETEMR